MTDNKNILSQWYWIIPNIVLFNEWLKDKEKLLYCFISSLCAKEWYCWAGNQYLADQLKNKTPKTVLTKQTVSTYVNSLKKQWFITIEYKYEWKQIIDRKIRMSDMWAIEVGGIKEILDTPKGNPDHPIKEILTDNSTTEYYNNNNLENKNSSSITREKVRDHMTIVNEYEDEGSFSVYELASKAVINTYEMDWLSNMATVFLDWCVWNKDKLEWKVNIKARFNKFVQTDYQWLLMKKATWPWVNIITDDEFIALMDEWYFRSSQCKFYQEVVKPTLTDDWLERFRLMVEFFRNKDVGWKKWKTFYEWAELKGYNNPKIF